VSAFYLILLRLVRLLFTAYTSNSTTCTRTERVFAGTNSRNLHGYDPQLHSISACTCFFTQFELHVQTNSS